MMVILFINFFIKLKYLAKQNEYILKIKNELRR